MRIVDRKTFLSIEKEVVYSKFSPCVFGDLSIKTGSLENDFTYQGLNNPIDVKEDEEFSEVLYKAIDNNEKIELDFDCNERDGMYDDTDMFAVWEVEDVKKLIARLEKVLKQELNNKIPYSHITYGEDGSITMNGAETDPKYDNIGLDDDFIKYCRDKKENIGKKDD